MAPRQHEPYNHSLSVVVPLYNQANHIGTLIRSCLNSLDLLHEVIVVNDSSTDNSESIIRNATKNTSQVRLVSLPINCGTFEARRVGLSIASGDYVIFLDADDELRRDGITEIRKRLTSNAPDLVFSPVIEKNDANRTLKFTNQVINHLINFYTFKNEQKLLKAQQFGIGGKIFKRETLVSAINSISNSELKKLIYGEDVLMTFLHLSHSRSWTASASAFYVYKPNDNSITHQRCRRAIFKKCNELRHIIDLIASFQLRESQGNISIEELKAIFIERLTTDRILMLRHINDFKGNSMYKQALVRTLKEFTTFRNFLRLLFHCVTRTKN